MGVLFLYFGGHSGGHRRKFPKIIEDISKNKKSAKPLFKRLYGTF